MLPKRSIFNLKSSIDKTVIVGLSGGVDSSVTAMLLHEAGYRVIGVFLHFWSDPVSAPLMKGGQGGLAKANKCCSIETMLQARKVADRLGIAFYSLDLSEVFKEKVVDYFLSAYSQGWTPNPCIMCNRDIKFGAVLDAFGTFGADYWATGHYAKIVQENGISKLFQPRDLDKDQTYFLHALTQEKLQQTLFPLGDHLKSEVRELATKLQVEHYGGTYRESQNLCFYAESEPDAFLERNLPPQLQKPGEIKTREGKVLGTHRGLFHYTVGQRRGLNIPSLGRVSRTRDGRGLSEGVDPQPYYVVGVDLPSNALIVGDKQDLLSTECRLSNVTFTRPVSPDELTDLDVKVRYSKTSVKGRVVTGSQSTVDSKNTAKPTTGYCELSTVYFDSPVRAVTPGQHAVFYRGGECLGGGVIVARP